MIAGLYRMCGCANILQPFHSRTQVDADKGQTHVIGQLQGLFDPARQIDNSPTPMAAQAVLPDFSHTSLLIACFTAKRSLATVRNFASENIALLAASFGGGDSV